MKKVLTLLLMLLPGLLAAAPYHGILMSFRQPDGSTVSVRLFGDEYYLRAESPDGYTLIRDPQSGWICYARLSADGMELASTGIPFTGGPGEEAVGGLPKHLDISGKAILARQAANRQLLGEPHLENGKSYSDSPPVLGEIKGLCIVVDFPDEPGTLPMSEFEDFCNDMSYSNFGNNGSLRTYYHDVSGGLVDYENVVFGYYRAPETFWHYDNMPYSQGAKTLLGLALNWIDSIGFDFSTLSTNPDGSIQAVNLMYTGYPPSWAQGMWWHMGGYNGFSADGVHTDAYNCSPANSPLEMAVVVHENGHMIGKWPDTYKYNSNTGPDGIGAFDLMCWYGSSTDPVPPNPYFASDAGWKTVTDVTYFNGIVTDTANSFSLFKYRNVNDSSEFFLFENREMSGRSVNIPDEGLTIWHIDRLGDNQTLHHEVFLEHANDDVYDHSGACFHGGFNNEFSQSSQPSSDLYNGDPSGLRIWEISPVSPVMSYKLGAGQSAPTFLLSYQQISNDNNGNGFPEPGETFDVDLVAGNYGQIVSGNTSVTCTAVGPNAGLITVNTPVVITGVLGISQSVNFSHNLTVAANTPLGTVIDLKFEITDGTWSTYITRHLVIGEVVLMSNLQVNTCGVVFYDNGGPFGNYTDMKNYFATFYPTGPNLAVKAQFTAFDLEEEPNCDYDFLRIYDGPNSSAPEIGVYCGTDSPGTVVSTHPGGALTFHFYSDQAVTGEGWTALMSCTSVTGEAGTEAPAGVLIYPNPSGGRFIVLTGIPGPSKLTVTDAIGKTVLTAEAGPEPFQIQLDALPDGVYQLSIRAQETLISQKIILQR